MILAIETATSICSVAATDQDFSEIKEFRSVGKGVHSRDLLRFIGELFDYFSCEIDKLKAIVMSHGPGSFTGLRIGSSAIKGLCLGRQIPVFSFNTTSGIAAHLLTKNYEVQLFHTVIDARRTHLYYQAFEQKGEIVKELDEVKILTLDEVRSRIKAGELVFGTGVERLKLSNEGQPLESTPDSISAVNLLYLLKQHARDLPLNTYIETLGKKSEELNIIYSLED